MHQSVAIRVISNEQKRNEFFHRVKLFCERNGLQYNVVQDEPYWKIEGLFEIEVLLEPSPVWNYGNWSEAFRYLFKEQFTIEWGQEDEISLCHYPAYDDFDSYFVIFCIPSKYFVPKPSRTIRH